MRIRLFLVFVLISFATRWLSLAVDVLDIDEAAHIVGSWELMRGKLLYTDFVNNKPPLLYVYYSVAQLLFGRTLFAVHLFTLLFTIPLTALALASFYNYRRTGIVAGVTFLVYSASFYAHDMLSSNTELLLILPASWAIAQFRKEHNFLMPRAVVCAGFLIGVALLFKYPVILWLIPVTITILYYGTKNGKSGRSALLIVLFLVSFAVPPALTYFYFVSRGGEQELIYWLFRNNLAYSANPISFREASGRAFSYLLPFLIVTAPLWWLSFSARLQPANNPSSPAKRMLLSGLILCTIPAAFWGFRFYPHYFIPFYIPLSLAAAPAINELSIRKSKPFFAYSIFILCGFMIANAVLYLGGLQVYQERNPAFRNVARKLKGDTCSTGGSLFAWGYAPIVYYYAGLPAASRFVVLPQSGLTSYVSGNLESVRGKIGTGQYIKEEHWNWLLSDLDKNHVTYIVDFSPSGIYRWNRYPLPEYPLLWQYVQRNFENIGSVDDVVVYRRIGCK